MDKLEFDPIGTKAVVALYDVTDSVKSWGRRGILGGGLFGFAIGIALVAIPFTTDVLTFGVAGTLLVAAVEGAVIAGAFGACAAALYGKGVRYGKAPTFDRVLPGGRRRLEVGWREGDIPLSDWPTGGRIPVQLPYTVLGGDDLTGECDAPPIRDVRIEETALTPSPF